jgi:hypothetical protein
MSIHHRIQSLITYIQDSIEQVAHDHDKPVDLWFRDDDVVDHTDQLDDFHHILEQYKMSCAFAVIPKLMNADALSEFFKDKPQYRLWQHGIAHHNHAPAAQKKTELYAPSTSLYHELQQYRQEMQWQFGRCFQPVLTPPWNRIHPTIIQELKRLGFSGVSCFGMVDPCDGQSHALDAVFVDDKEGAQEHFHVINAHLDIIDWKAMRFYRQNNRPDADAARHHIKSVAMAEKVDGKTALEATLPDLDQFKAWLDAWKHHYMQKNSTFGQEQHQENPRQIIYLSILTHHLVHTEVQNEFLHIFMDFAYSSPCVRVADMSNWDCV